ncbi:MAG: ATP-binding cassette domain-containing protein [Clostridia bacterium]|nr:ATP-binding cassette domain-containing protein [Clostridia bacterium]
MIKFVNVTKHYHYEAYPTIEKLSFEIDKDKTTTLLLETQSGKTTIAKLILGIETPTDGEIFFNDKPIAETAVNERNIAYFPSEPIFFENKSVAKNLAYPLKIRNMPKDEIALVIEKAAKEHGFELEQKVKKLSVEKRIELSLVRASLRKVDLIILDDFPAKFYYLMDLLPKVTTMVMTSKVENALGDIVLIKDNLVTKTVTKEKSYEYIKNTVWLRGDEFAENTEET